MSAEIILEQIGGSRRLKMFVGAYDFLKDGENTLMFKFKGSRKANYLKITLNSMDLYDMEFMTLVKLSSKNVMKWINLSEEELTKKMKKNQKTFDNIYFDQLMEIFEQHTGLFLHT